MVDTVKIFLKNGKIENSIFENLSHLRESRSQYGISRNANFRNFKIFDNSESGLLLRGSLSKLIKQDTLINTKRIDIKEAIELLSDHLKINVNEGVLRRLDIAKNITLNHSPHLYFNGFGAAKNYVRNEVGNTTLLYKNTVRQFSLYDKIAESKASRTIIPYQFLNENLMRIEARFMQDVSKQFNRSQVLVSDLTDENFYNELASKWLSEYNKIFKIRNIKTFDYSMLKSKKQLNQHGLLFYIESRGGLNFVLPEVKQAQSLGQLTRKQAFDLRNEYLKANGSQLLTVESDLIREIDEKVNHIIFE